MALQERRTIGDALQLILDDVAERVGHLGIPDGDPSTAKAVLRVVLEDGVDRVVQAYWTGFRVTIPGGVIGLHLEVAEPRVRWAECYLTPRYRNWFMAFHERADGEMQLAYYQDYESPKGALARFFSLANWYILLPSGLTWKDVVSDVDPDLPWTEHRKTLAAPTTNAAVQESLKKSTIIWLRWIDAAGVERTMPVWFLFDAKADKLYVLSGERQQTIPGATQLREVTVIPRWKGKNAQIGEIPAGVRVLPHGPEWDEVAEKIAEKRLNIPGLPEETAKRWRDECHILDITLRT